MASIFPYKDGYRVMVRRPGHKPRSATFKKLRDAERWGRTIESEMDRKVYLAPTGIRANKVFEKFRDEVCPTRKGCKWETVRINRLLRTCSWLVKPVEDVDRFDIQAFKEERLLSVSNASVNRELNLISGIFQYAMKEWGIALRVNPVHEVARPPKTPARLRRVAASEEEKVRAEFDITKPPRRGYGAVRDTVPWMFLIAIETGARMSELLRLEWKDVHLDESWFWIADSKNGDPRVVPMSEKAEAMFQALHDAPQSDLKGRVFPINILSFGATYRKWCKTNGVVDLHFHDTKHEAASRLAKELDPRDHAKMLGHRDLNTTLNVYYNPSPVELVTKLRKSGKTSEVS